MPCFATTSKKTSFRCFRSLDASPDAVFITDRSNRVVFWNEAARRVLGFDSDEAVGTLCSELLRGTDAYGNRYCTTNCPVMNLANRSETVRHFGLTLETREREPVMTDINVLQLRGADGYYLVHMVRAAGTESRAAAVEPAAEQPPRPHLVAVRDSATCVPESSTSGKWKCWG